MYMKGMFDETNGKEIIKKKNCYLYTIMMAKESESTKSPSTSTGT
jgi:hypothetical protein